MHPMHHQIQVHRTETMQIQQQQQQQQQQQPTNQQQQNQQEEQQEQASMTVLESLEPAQPQPQPILSILDPVQQQASQQQQEPPVIHHLVQQQPQLHQLQAPNRTHLELTVTNSQLDDQQQHQHQHHHQHHHHQSQPHLSQQTGSKGSLVHQRPHIEGIVVDGGGPIVQWLLDNYEIADGESLPRSTVYNHYLAHCRQLQMSSVNAASFGKLIRSVFVGLKTRRLGTRGHSKYHYFGVRAKQHVRLDWVREEHELGGDGAGCSSRDNENSNQNTDNGSESDSTGGAECGRLSASAGSGKRIKRTHGSSGAAHMRRTHHNVYQQDRHHDAEHHIDHNHHHHHHEHHQLDSNGLYYSNGTSNGYADGVVSSLHHKQTSNGTGDCFVWPTDHCDLADFRNHLGANWATLVDDHWPAQCESLKHPASDSCLVDNQTISLMEIFELNYKSYYKRMVELLSELKFAEVEQLWFDFWHPAPTAGQHSSQGTQLVHWTGNENPNQTATQATTNTGGQQNGQHVASGGMSQHQPQQQQHIEYHQSQAVIEMASHQVNNNLTFNHLYQLTSQPIIIERINQIDYSLYAAIEAFLLPDILSPIPRPLAQHIRMFAKNIGSWIELAVKDYTPQFVTEKSKSSRAFGHALRRYTSINHLSTASRAIWDKRSVLTQMSMDLSRVDLRDIEHQVALMSQGTKAVNESGGLLGSADGATTPTTVVGHTINNSGNREAATNTTLKSSSQDPQHDNNENTIIDHQHHSDHLDHQNNRQHDRPFCAMQPAQLIQNFLHLLEDPYPANSWPDWCRNLVESRVCGQSFEDARNFILKWNFYISLIMKELTLKSAPSLGSFQLIRLLFDEYMYYLVVSKLARAERKTLAQMLKPSTGFENM